MPASRFLKIVQETGQIPVCSFYLPVSTLEPHCTCIYIYLCKGRFIYVYVCIGSGAAAFDTTSCTCIYKYIHIYMQIYIYMYKYIHMYIHIYIYVYMSKKIRHEGVLICRDAQWISTVGDLYSLVWACGYSSHGDTLIEKTKPESSSFLVVSKGRA